MTYCNLGIGYVWIETLATKYYIMVYDAFLFIAFQKTTLYEGMNSSTEETGLPDK